MGWIGLGVKISSKAGGGIVAPAPWSPVNTEVTTYFNGLITPVSEAQQILVDTFVSSIKAGFSITNLSDFFDIMYILAGETQESSLRNLVKNSHYATAVNNPVFTAFEGFISNITSSYIRTNYNPSTEADNISLNNISIGIYSRSTYTATLKYDMGGTDTTGYLTLMAKTSANTVPRLNTDGSGLTAVPISETLGLISASRTAANNYVCYQNKTTLGTITENSVAIPNIELYLLGMNNNGTPVYGNRQLAFAYVSKHMTTAMRDVLFDAFEAYMDANLKGVV